MNAYVPQVSELLSTAPPTKWLTYTRLIHSQINIPPLNGRYGRGIDGSVGGGNDDNSNDGGVLRTKTLQTDVRKQKEQRMCPISMHNIQYTSAVHDIRYNVQNTTNASELTHAHA